MNLLIVDDNPANRTLVAKILAKNHTFFFAEDGKQAIATVFREEPDLVLMDVLMPNMDGITATQKIREQYTKKWLPIILLSALHDEDKIIEGLNAGADDYLTKPINPCILLAKIKAIQHALNMQNKLLTVNKQLLDYQQHNEIEHALTQDIFNQLIQYKDFHDDRIHFWIKPSKGFSGDLISIKRISPTRFYFLMADATGHGLAASLPTIIVNQVFQSMTEKQFLVSSIAKEINHRLRTDIPLGRFVALAIGLLDTSHHTIEVWNGGLPDLLLINDSGKLIHHFQSRHVAAGIVENSRFDEATEIFFCAEACELFAYTDGITDVMNSHQNEFGEQQLINILLQNKAGERLVSIKNAVLDFMDTEREQDDISCLSIRCH